MNILNMKPKTMKILKVLGISIILIFAIAAIVGFVCYGIFSDYIFLAIGLGSIFGVAFGFVSLMYSFLPTMIKKRIAKSMPQIQSMLESNPQLIDKIAQTLNIVGKEYCKYCGEKIEKDSRFCKKCGKELVAEQEDLVQK